MMMTLFMDAIFHFPPDCVGTVVLSSLVYVGRPDNIS